MCNLYSVKTSRKTLMETFRLSDNRIAVFEPLAAIFPGHMAPIIKATAEGDRELVLRSWGFVLLRDGYAPKRVTNARDDKLETRFWADSFATRRCLVPATSFCEPDEGRPARWHWFALKDAQGSQKEPRPLFAFAGLYRQWRGPIKKDGPNVDMEVFSFVTTLPNALTQTINHERSPVLLTTPEECATWLGGRVDEARAVIRPSDPAGMHIVQSGADKLDRWGAPEAPAAAPRLL